MNDAKKITAIFSADRRWKEKMKGLKFVWYFFS